MKTRKERLSVIVDLLARKMIGTQEELLSELSMLGYPVTQATLSRDLKQLKISKAPNGLGGYTYVMSSSIDTSIVHGHDFNKHVELRPTIHSINRTSNIIVIKSSTTHARLMSLAFDAMDDTRLLASFSIAGTILLVLGPNIDGDGVYKILTSVINPEHVNPYRSALDLVS